MFMSSGILTQPLSGQKKWITTSKANPFHAVDLLRKFGIIKCPQPNLKPQKTYMYICGKMDQINFLQNKKKS